jgi:hypothetical protein
VAVPLTAVTLLGVVVAVIGLAAVIYLMRH